VTRTAFAINGVANQPSSPIEPAPETPFSVMLARLRLRAMGRQAYDLIVIGSGPAGEKGAARAAYFGKRVAVIERSTAHGGAVANTGVPGKAMRETALYLSGYRKRDLHGISMQYRGALGVHEFLHRGFQVRHSLDTWIDANLERHRVAVYRGLASFEDPHTVRVVSQGGATTITGDVVLIATGSRPRALGDGPPGQPDIYDSDSILRMATVPRSLIVIGAPWPSGGCCRNHRCPAGRAGRRQAPWAGSPWQ